MKLVTFRAGEAAHIGMADPDTGQLFDLTQSALADGSDAPVFSSMLALIDAGDWMQPATCTRVVGKIPLSSPICPVRHCWPPCPSRVRCVTA